MYPFKFIIRSLWYFRRRHLAVFTGTLISAAVLTGALVVGDSVKHSLRQIVKARLGNTEFALRTGDRFIGSGLGEKMAKELDAKSASLLLMQGMARNPAGGTELSRVQVAGIDSSFVEVTGKNIPVPGTGEALISENTADRLNAGVGDFILIRVNESSPIPVNAPFAAETSTVALRLKVTAVLGAAEMGRFSLQSIQSAPFNVFVSGEELSAKLNLENRVNTVLLSGGDVDLAGVQEAFSKNWQFSDAGLQIRLLDQDVIELTTDRIFIDPPVIKAIDNLDLREEKILTYLVNDLGHNGRHTPYSFVSAATPPLIPEDLENNETIINQWLADDLSVKQGDTLTFTYYVIGPLRRLEETSRNFVVKDVIPVQDYLSGSSLMPDFPGLADAGSCSEWNSSVPIDLDRIRDKDETYWDAHRGTPKALINISAGTEMWGNEFGNYTGVRFSAEDITAENLQQELSDALSPSDLGLAFRPVKEEGYHAVEHAVDFAGLFLSLSFFVIAAAVLLTALLFGLAAESRRQEAGILAAMGFRKQVILKIQLAEALLVALLGSVAGAFAGLLYNQVILAALNSVWQDVVRTQMLSVHVNPLSLITGAIISVLIAAAIMFIVIRKKLKQPLALLVKGATVQKLNANARRKYMPAGIAIFTLLAGSLLVAYSLFFSDDINSALFLTAGGLFLLGLMLLISSRLEKIAVQNHRQPLSRWQLALKNLSRNRNRSLYTIVLLALGTFTIVITGANRSTFYGADDQNQSGTGGYDLWIETSAPVTVDLNTQGGKEKFGLEDDLNNETAEFLQFSVLYGDDASCLNLNQVSRPRILGVVPEVLQRRHSFTFVKTLKGISPEAAWMALDKKFDDNVIPAIADQTVITWGLMMKVGDTLVYLNERGDEIKLLLIGGLANSVFQGNLLISDSAFRANFPSSGGSQVMMADVNGETDDAANMLKNRLADLGIGITPTNVRLAEFNSVTNTYLSVFMILGWLGMLIGTVGLGVVILRNLLERRQETALMLAVGFTAAHIRKILFAENLILLLAGLVAGILSAVIGILPSLLSPAYAMDGWFTAGLLLLIFINGLVWIYLSSRAVFNKQIINSLRQE